MRLRSTGFPLLFILALLAAPLASEAQRAGKVWRIGWLSGGSPTTAPDLNAAFREKLRQLGYVEGQNLLIEYRWAEGRYDRLPELAADLVRLNVDAIFTASDQPIKAARQATSTIPIVMVGCDAVAAGLISSLARPGGNITGITCISSEIAAKRIGLFKEALTRLPRMAVLFNADDLGKFVEMQVTKAAAGELDIQVLAFGVRHPDELEGAFAAMRREQVTGLITLGDSFTSFHRHRIHDLAMRGRFPTMYAYREFVAGGGLMAYGPNLAEEYRLAATYVDKILKGAKPADLPVEQPTKFELVINMKTAKALGLTIPQSVLLRADELIQ
jgi:putative ABC transport system substrate-binding protein